MLFLLDMHTFSVTLPGALKYSFHLLNSSWIDILMILRQISDIYSYYLLHLEKINFYLKNVYCKNHNSRAKPRNFYGKHSTNLLNLVLFEIKSLKVFQCRISLLFFCSPICSPFEFQFNSMKL